MLRSAASDLVLYCLPMSHKKTLGLYWLTRKPLKDSNQAIGFTKSLTYNKLIVDLVKTC